MVSAVDDGCPLETISNVIASVEKEFGTKSDDGGQSDDTDLSAGSLELSETQSQPFDPLEPVTQPEDVPAQLAAEKERKKRKVQRAAVR